MKRDLAIIIVSLLVATTFFQINTEGFEGSTRNPPFSGLISHLPIEINGNNDLNKTNGVVYGTGTEQDPYIIQGWDINADVTDFGIYIGNTTKHVIIKNCHIHHANDDKGDYGFNQKIRYSNGITLKNVKNCVIEKCVFDNNRMTDIQLFDSEWNTIRFNDCNSIYAYGHLILQSSSNNSILGNEVDSHKKIETNGSSSSLYGIFFIYNSDDNSVIGNKVNNHTRVGIFAEYGFNCNRINITGNVVFFNQKGIQAGGQGHVISDNMVRENSATGIYCGMVYEGKISRNICEQNSMGILLNYDGGSGLQGKNVVHDNIVRYNTEEGIYVRGRDDTYYNNRVVSNLNDGFSIRSHRNDIYMNHVEDNGGYGISLKNAQGNKIYWNNMINNSNSPQGLDECNNNSWNNTLKGNYWSDHTSPDANSDGIVDIIYLVNTTLNNSDRKPVTTPFNISTVSPMMSPMIIASDFELAEVNKTSTISFSAIDHRVDSGYLKWNISTNATWLNITGTNIEGRPSSNDVGRYWIDLSVNDGSESDRRNITLIVIPETIPDDGPGNGTGNNTNPDNDTDPGNNTGNDTEPGADPGNDTEPIADPGNNTENDTEPDNPVEWTEDTNNPPGSLEMDMPTGELKEGEKIILRASSFDPDSQFGDVVTYRWYIDGIGEVGIGDTLEITLPEGTYVIRLVATDEFGSNVEISREITIIDTEDQRPNLNPIFFVAALVVILLIFIGSIFIFKKNKGSKGIEETYPGEPLDFQKEPSFSKEGIFIQGDIPKITSGKLPFDPEMEGMMEVPSIGGVELSMNDEIELRELESGALTNRRIPGKIRRRELQKLLIEQKDSIEMEAYVAARSILEEE